MARHPFRLFPALALAAALVAGAETPAHAHEAAGEPTTKVLVRVDDKAGVQGAILNFAEARAGQVFAPSGVRLEWIDGEDANRRKIVAPYTIVIMAEAPAKLKAQAEHLGLDVMGQGAPLAGRAYIYYDRVVRVLVPPRDLMTTLGDVMAHELGHLMLPPGHSLVGIMRPGINMTSRRLESFTSEQGAAIRDRLRRAAATDVPPRSAEYFPPPDVPGH